MIRKYKGLSYKQMLTKYNILLKVYRRLFIKYLHLSSKKIKYLKYCGIKPPKRHIKKYYDEKVFKKVCPKINIEKYLHNSRKVIHKVSRKSFGKLTKVTITAKISSKYLLKLGCDTKIIEKVRKIKQITWVSSGGKRCICPRVYRPVCGANKVTYANECSAGCAKVKVVHKGKCNAKCEN